MQQKLLSLLITPMNQIPQIHASPAQFVLAITGGGSGALSALLETPDASKTVLEAVIPYSEPSLQQWLGHSMEQACSESTARAMAMVAWERARALSTSMPDANLLALRGLGATSSLATSRTKQGSHRVHVAWQSAEKTVVVSVELEKGKQTRAEEEAIASSLILEMVAEACGLEATPPSEPGRPRPRHERHEKRAPLPWTELLLHQRTSVLIPTEEPTTSTTEMPACLFPGAFHPFHTGHQKMAQVAARKLGVPVTFELSISNVDKRSLDFIEIDRRLRQFANHNVLLTHAATFVEKATIAPGATFVVGADTIGRLGDPKYYGQDVQQRDTAIATIANLKCRFLVFGRWVEDRFQTLGDLPLPIALRTLCEEVPGTEFREDISSTAKRNADCGLWNEE